MASTDTIHFDLDTVERDTEFEIFAANINDRRIEISDPADIAYQDLLACDTPMEFFRYTMSVEDRDFLAEQRIAGWRLGKLLEAYLKHYRAEERIDERKKIGF